MLRNNALNTVPDIQKIGAHVLNLTRVKPKIIESRILVMRCGVVGGGNLNEPPPPPPLSFYYPESTGTCTPSKCLLTLTIPLPCHR